MFDGLPIRVWLLLLAGITAFAPGRYVFRHLMHAPNRRDITLPPEDLSWRSTNRFTFSLIALVCLAAFSIFIFTPAAVVVAHAPQLWPALMFCFGSWMLVTVVRGFSTGKIEPMSRGNIGTFDQTTQPKRFWASMVWNGLWGCAAFWITIAAYRDTIDHDLTAQCQNEHDELSYEAHVTACTRLISHGSRYDRQTLAWAYSVRGMAFYRHQEWPRALNDFSRAIELDPENAAYAHFNRAYVYMHDYKLKPALGDLTAVIQSNPNDPAAYALRAWIYEHLDDETHASEDRAKFKILAGKHPKVVKVQASK